MPDDIPPSDHLNACAALVERGDPDRFLAAMAAPPRARGVLFPLFAYNLEVARAPYVTSEPMLAEIRLQWWRDALEEIRTGQPPRRHEVVTPLAAILDPEGCEAMTRIADARHWDVARAPFLSVAQFQAHLDATAGNLAWTAARLLGAGDEDRVRRVARAEGLARWFIAVPALRAQGLAPLVDNSPEAIAQLARGGLDDLKGPRPSRPGRIATLSAWEARFILTQAAQFPACVVSGGLMARRHGRKARLFARAMAV